jgi:hypothetical protein
MMALSPRLRASYFLEACILRLLVFTVYIFLKIMFLASQLIMREVKGYWIYLELNNMNCSVRLDSDHKKSRLWEDLSSTDYQSAADEIAKLSYKSGPAGVPTKKAL